LIEKASEGEEVIIARGAKLVARLIAIEVKGKRQPGSLKGKLLVGPEFFEPLPATELAGWGIGSFARNTCSSGGFLTIRD